MWRYILKEIVFIDRHVRASRNYYSIAKPKYVVLLFIKTSAQSRKVYLSDDSREIAILNEK